MFGLCTKADTMRSGEIKGTGFTPKTDNIGSFEPRSPAFKFSFEPTACLPVTGHELRWSCDNRLVGSTMPNVLAEPRISSMKTDEASEPHYRQ